MEAKKIILKIRAGQRGKQIFDLIHATFSVLALNFEISKNKLVKPFTFKPDVFQYSENQNFKFFKNLFQFPIHCHGIGYILVFTFSFTEILKICHFFGTKQYCNNVTCFKILCNFFLHQTQLLLEPMYTNIN